LVTLTAIRRWPSGVLITLLGLVFQFGNIEWIRNLEFRSLDDRMRFSAQDPTPEIAIVAIDDATLNRIGRWPFPRSHHARLIDRLAGAGAKVIVFDAFFPLPDHRAGRDLLEEVRRAYSSAAKQDARFVEKLSELERTANTDAAFADAIRRAGNVILAEPFFFETAEDSQRAMAAALQDPWAYSTRQEPETGPSPATVNDYYHGWWASRLWRTIPELRAAAGVNLGHNIMYADSDDVVRRASVAIGHQGRLYPPLAVQALRVYRGVRQSEMILLHDADGLRAIDLGSERISLPDDGEMLINFRLDLAGYLVISMADALRSTYGLEKVRGKIVLVGATSASVGDIKSTPRGSHPGVLAHAALIDSLLTKRLIYHAPGWINGGIILLFGLGAAVALDALHPRWILPATAIACLGYVILAYWLMAAGIWLALAAPIVTLLLASLWTVRRILAVKT
jgi:CHASE2 domain-containing sensor protein